MANTLLIFSTGVHAVAYAFPKVKLVTTAVDREVNDEFHILPGIGMLHHKLNMYHAITQLSFDIAGAL